MKCILSPLSSSSCPFVVLSSCPLHLSLCLGLLRPPNNLCFLRCDYSPTEAVAVVLCNLQGRQASVVLVAPRFWSTDRWQVLYWKSWVPVLTGLRAFYSLGSVSEKSQLPWEDLSLKAGTASQMGVNKPAVTCKRSVGCKFSADVQDCYHCHPDCRCRCWDLSLLVPVLTYTPHVSYLL